MTVGDQIDPRYVKRMKALARLLDRALNPYMAQGERGTGFVLLVYPFDEVKGSRCNYISNGARDDVRVMMKEMVARFEGQPKQEGHG